MSNKNSREIYQAEGKTNLFQYNPENLVIVDDPKHPLYDERMKLEIDEAMVKNIMFHGVIEPVIIRKNPETGDMEVVDGRQRVKNCREANRRLIDRGEEPHRISAVVRKADESVLAGVMVSANEIRKEDSPLNKAQKMARLKEMGKTDEELCVIFGIGPQTIQNYLSLLECPEVVRNAIESGQLVASEAYKLAKLKPAEQKETLARMLAAADPSDKPRERSRKMKEASGTGPQRRTKKEVELFRLNLEEKCADPVYREAATAVLRWVLGGPKPRFPKFQKDQTETETAVAS